MQLNKAELHENVSKFESWCGEKVGYYIHEQIDDVHSRNTMFDEFVEFLTD